MTDERRDTERGAHFDRVAREVAPHVRSYALRRTDGDTAQDVLAETLLVLWRRLEDVPEGAELPWCYAVARNCLANAERSARRQRGLVARIARLDPPRETAPPDAPDPTVHRALARLPADDRELVRLWAWEQLAPREIAVVLGVSANAVSVRLHRLRRRLAAELGTEGPDGQETSGAGHQEVEERRAP